MKKDKKSIAILGTSVLNENRGVQALAESLVNLCAGPEGDNEIFIMVGNKESLVLPFEIKGKVKQVPVINYRLSPKAKFKEHLAWIIIACLLYRFLPFSGVRKLLRNVTPWIDVLLHVDLVGDIRGGDSFSDIYGMKRFIIGFLEELTVLLIRGNIVQFPQTFGPYQKPLSRILARFLLRHSSIIVARDEQSQATATELLGGNRKILLCPDVAFTLPAKKPESLETYPKFQEYPSKGVIGINVNGLMYNGGYNRKNMFGLKMDYRNLIPVLIENLLAEHEGELWLVPHTYGPPGPESDPEACSQVRASLPAAIKKRVRIVTGIYDCRQIKGVIGMCDFFIGSRMHACIAALSQGIPCVGIAYSRKFQGVFATVGMGTWVVDGRTVGNEAAISRVLELYGNRNSVQRSLKQKIKDAKEKVEEIFYGILNE